MGAAVILLATLFTKETGGGKQAQYLVVLAWQERDSSRGRRGREMRARKQTPAARKHVEAPNDIIAIWPIDFDYC